MKAAWNASTRNLLAECSGPKRLLTTQGIAGGFALMILELGTWMAAGILIAKAIGELLLGPALRREMEKKSAQKTSP